MTSNQSKSRRKAKATSTNPPAPKPKNTKRVDELLGVDTRSTQTANQWEALLRAGRCPFTSVRCTKTRKGDVTLIIGTYTLRYSSTPTVICPNRFLGRNSTTNHIQLFQDAAELTGTQFKDINYVSEVNIPGGQVDFVLFTDGNEGATNIVGIEIQTMDTTGSAWPNREIFLKAIGITATDLLSPTATPKQIKTQYGMNWKMTAKTILVQILHKFETFAALDGKLFLAIQGLLWHALLENFNFSEIEANLIIPKM